MRKSIVTFLFIILMMFIVTPINTKALTVKDTVFSSVYILDEEEEDESNPEKEEVKEWIENNTGKEQNCDGSENSLLGDPEDPNSVAWLVQQIFNFIKVVGPILVVILSSVDFVQVIIKSDDEAMAKAQKKLITRLILAALLFVVPTIVEVILDVFGMTSSSTCGIK